MSFDAQAWARKIKTGSTLRKAVLMSIANRANDADGACWPSQQRIADEVEACVRAVRNAMADLEDMNLIRRVKRKDTTDLIFLNMQDPGEGSTITPQARRAGDGSRQSAPADQRNDVPRQEIPVGEESDAGGDRNLPPEGAESGAGDQGNLLPTNLSVEPSLNLSGEPKANRKKPRKTAAWPDDFREQFWKLYPKKRGDSRKAAWTKLEKVHDDDEVEFIDLMAGLRHYADRMNASVKEDSKNERFIAAASVWINQARWETERAPDRGGRPRPGMAI
ncbi:helix-turn-helix domain-containing protein [Bradyrhizobium sp. SZCCHNR3118]|uniref:helix-turn-helix domain-containing protein n=1 Tax=Bradyrhizobium sp. SZCCHNR3118 TaxID=3057468 RepID=UPI00291617AB|nr:helix-turn-helix domain-containing protein [Bradyrhizobium sp. SZCCHNR3118]